MEGFELISTGAWSIVPPILALGLALITKEVYSSLLAGVFSGHGSGGNLPPAVVLAASPGKSGAYCAGGAAERSCGECRVLTAGYCRENALGKAGWPSGVCGRRHGLGNSGNLSSFTAGDSLSGILPGRRAGGMALFQKRNGLG